MTITNLDVKHNHSFSTKQQSTYRKRGRPTNRAEGFAITRSGKITQRFISEHKKEKKTFI